MAKDKKQNDLELEDEAKGDAAEEATDATEETAEVEAAAADDAAEAEEIETVQVHRGNHFANVPVNHPEAKRHLANLAAAKKAKKA